MKIDTTMIPGFDSLPEAARNAIADMEFDDVPDMTKYVEKSVFDKKASEAADLGKKLRARMSEDEAKAAKDAEERDALMTELEQLRAEKVVDRHTNKFLGLGYDEKLARETAVALAAGDTELVFKNHAKFIADREKALKAEILKSTPTPPAGDGAEKKSKDEFKKLSLAEKQQFARENPELYKDYYKTEE